MDITEDCSRLKGGGMVEKNKTFTLYLTEKKLSDAAMKQNIQALERKEIPNMHFRASYVPPYEESALIRKFQYRSAYRPFIDDAKKEKNAVIYLSEWIGHEGEEHLESFVKFLHDYRAFFDFNYYFVAERVDENGAKVLFDVLSDYMGKGIVRSGNKKQMREREGNV